MYLCCILCIIFLVHPCDRSDNGGCQQKCNKDGDEFTCSCDKGFKLADDKAACSKSEY